MKVTINVPSLGRAGIIGIARLFPEPQPELQLWVREDEVELYEEAHPDITVKPHPKKVGGNIARVRNFILDQETEAGTDVVTMMDDDVATLGYFEARQRLKFEQRDIVPFIEQQSLLCLEWGLHLWGVNVNADKQNYREYTPFSTLSPVLGPFCNHVRSPIRYDERLPLKDDYDLALQHMHRFRGVLRLNKYWYEAGHGLTGNGQAGGCSTYRTVEREKQQFELMQSKWGPEVVQQDTHGSRNHRSEKKRKHADFNPIIRCPLKGI